jgi:signal transduction histidine kinase
LNVNNKLSGRVFSGNDEDLLITIVYQAARSIENLAMVETLPKKTRELEQVHVDLMKLHKGLTRFVCSLSHELKPPLISVLGFADLLLNFLIRLMQPEFVNIWKGFTAKHSASISC